MFIDTHTHLFSEQFKDDFETVINESMASGVEKMFLPNVDLKSIDQMYKVAATFPENCFPMMGLHPCSVKEDYEEVLVKMEQEFEKYQFWAIGETGIDLHWDTSTQKWQESALRIQVEWAKKYKLPIVLHTRKAFNETYSIIKEMNDENLTGVFHCFADSAEDAKKVTDLDGFYVGIGGVLTFKNSGLDKIVADIPMESMVLETDSPYLAPTPHRGKRNESKYIPLVAQKMADIKRITIEEVAKITTTNAERLYQL